jgi:transposase
VGASPNFPPLGVAKVVEQVSALLRRSPRCAGWFRSRWWLEGIRQSVEGFYAYSLAGVWKVLRRLRLHYKRGREYVHSPDLAYDVKMMYLKAAAQQAHTDPDKVVLLYMDELTYYRRPSLARAYAPANSPSPVAASGHRSNLFRRIATVLNVVTGQTVSWQRRRFNATTLLAFFHSLPARFPHAERIFIALDNWSVHFHPRILLALQHTPITLLRLPTYAPWTNPVEKFWHRLKAEVLHLHDFDDDWLGLQAAVQAWLDLWRDPSDELLHYVGLTPY